jgi:hypothetical protein
MAARSCRSLIATLVAGATLVLPRSRVRANHEYVAVIMNTELGPDGALGLVGTTLVVEKRAAYPEHIDGCNGALLPAYQVQIERDGGRRKRLLLGIDPTFHPDPPVPDPAQPGDRFVVRETGSGDCGDGTSLLFLLPAP